jgi:hypothetical protein
VEILFTNTLEGTRPLTIKKVVDYGTYTPRSSFFSFELNMSGLEPGKVYVSDTSDILEADSEGNASMYFNLEDDESIKFDALPIGAKYTITEEAIKSYRPSYDITTEGTHAINVVKAHDEANECRVDLSTATETIDEEDYAIVTFTNHYEPDMSLNLKINKRLAYKDPKTGELKYDKPMLNKAIESNGLSTEEKFKFKVVLKNTDDPLKIYEAYIEEGKTTQIKDIPFGNYEIIEDNTRAPQFTWESLSLSNTRGVSLDATRKVLSMNNNIQEGTTATLTLVNAIEFQNTSLKMTKKIGYFENEGDTEPKFDQEGLSGVFDNAGLDEDFLDMNFEVTLKNQETEVELTYGVNKNSVLEIKNLEYGTYILTEGEMPNFTFVRFEENKHIDNVHLDGNILTIDGPILDDDYKITVVNALAPIPGVEINVNLFLVGDNGIYIDE